MTPYQLVNRLRRKGYRVTTDRSGRLRVSGGRPRDPEGTAELLSARQLELEGVLRAEQGTAVKDAMEALGARIIDVVVAGEERAKAEEWCPGDPKPGAPKGWRFASEFTRYLSSIGARLFIDGEALVIIAPRDLLSRNVVAGLRCFRGAAIRAASRVVAPAVGEGEERFSV